MSPYLKSSHLSQMNDNIPYTGTRNRLFFEDKIPSLCYHHHPSHLTSFLPPIWNILTLFPSPVTLSFSLLYLLCSLYTLLRSCLHLGRFPLRLCLLQPTKRLSNQCSELIASSQAVTSLRLLWGSPGICYS